MKFWRPGVQHRTDFRLNSTILLDLLLYDNKLLFSSNTSGKSLFLTQNRTSTDWQELKLTPNINYNYNEEEIVYKNGQVTNIPKDGKIMCLADTYVLGLQIDSYIICNKIEKLI